MLGGVVCLSELVQTLWFEDVGFLHEQMLDTPLGRFSIRQMCLFLVFGLLAWVASLVFVDLVLKIVVAGAVFFTGAVLFTRKIKTVSPETHLLYLIRRFLPIKQNPSTQTKNTLPVEQVSKSTLLLSATLGVPVKVVGVLKDFSGKILAGKPFKVHINNTAHSKGSTDAEGYFCTYFIPERSGCFEVAVQSEDTPEAIQQITIQVNPKTETEQEEEEKQNAETIKPKTQT
jgi:hypothetical protein